MGAKQIKFERTANPEMAAAMRELRRSNAASPHTIKSQKGTRRARSHRAIKDSYEGGAE